MEAHPPAKRQRVVSRRAAEAAAAAAAAATAAAAKNHTPKNHTTHQQRPRLGGSTPAEKARIAGSRLKLPLPVQLATAEGVKHGLLIGGNWESEKLRLQFECRVLAPSKAAKVAMGTSSEVNGLLMWKWSPNPGEYHSLHDLRAAGVVLEKDSETGAAQELVVLAALRGKPKKQPPPIKPPAENRQNVDLAGLRLQLPLPLQIATAEGAKNGLLVSGDWEGAPPLQVQFEGRVLAPSKAAKLATGKDSEVNGLLMWKWTPNPDESYSLRYCHSLHNLRAAGVTLQPQPSSHHVESSAVNVVESNGSHD